MGVAVSASVCPADTGVATGCAATTGPPVAE